MKSQLNTIRIKTDVLIIGGGTAGTYAAMTLARNSDKKILIAERANIKRSGCLAAGVNAINAYITEGKTPEDYVEYARRDAAGIIREDLVLSGAKEFNQITKDLEDLGLVILKDGSGNYVTRGDRNIKINGENIKPLLAEAVASFQKIQVLNQLNITDLLVEDQQIQGAMGFSILEPTCYLIEAPFVLVATGGASGLYRPNNPGFSRHKMWYPPFNTGAGYAMGIRAGAEMTSLEMRFIALRCKDTIAPTGTIAQGVKARQINSRNQEYESRYGITTSERVYGTLMENRLGNGPCYLETKGKDPSIDQDLWKAYLNMAPSQTLKWLERASAPSLANVEITGTEPYIVGGHTASGYWVDTNRQTTILGLYAAGDVAGGFPQKYVTGALAEGKIAALAILRQSLTQTKCISEDTIAGKISEYGRFLDNQPGIYSCEELEEAMQKIMDEYAGGIASHYQYNQAQLQIAYESVLELEPLVDDLSAANLQELMLIYQLKERLLLCKSLIAHLSGRKETRWHSFHEHLDYPDKDPEFFCYVNSVLVGNQIEIRYRELVRGAEYEHQN